jgi:4-diphosphocytidyl-2-C-methyl-D-erythritol kinase
VAISTIINALQSCKNVPNLQSNPPLSMLRFPNCKINLGLYVTRKREDGYHDIETVFYPLIRHSFSEGGSSLCDVLEVVASSHANLHLSGLNVAGNTADNLVWKAYYLLQREFPGKVPTADIYLHKVIPMCAGLGGGSADGAFMLSLLNDYCGLLLSNGQLAAYALQLGSDCPFFIYNTPQFASGRGEQMSDIAVDLSDYSIQLICPQVHVSTGKAFGMIMPRKAPFDLRRLHELPLEQWKGNLSNDFEPPVFGQHPVLSEIKMQLYDGGAIYASMSGSGSAIYGIFPKGQKAEVKADVPFEGFYVQ